MKSIRKMFAGAGVVALLVGGVALVAPSAAQATGFTYGTMTLTHASGPLAGQPFDGPYASGDVVHVAFSGMQNSNAAPAAAAPFAPDNGGGIVVAVCVGDINAQFGPSSCQSPPKAGYFFGDPGSGSFDITIPTKGAVAGYGGSQSTYVCDNTVAGACSIAVTDFRGNGPTQAPIKYAVSSSTTLTATGPGSTPALDAAVTVTDSTVAAGSVQFKDGASNLGSPVTLDGTGHATLTSPPLAGGSHSLSAVFTAADPSIYSGSTGTASYSAPAAATTTALSVSTGTGVAFTPVTLSATISPAAAGSVAFTDGAVSLGSSAVVAGVATKTVSSLGAGAHTITATFTPTSSTAYSGSSDVQSFSLTAPAGESVDGNVITEVQPGTLDISTPYTNPDGTSNTGNPLDLGPASLQADGSAITTAPRALADCTSTCQYIRVVDTRAGNPGWTVSMRMTDFTGPGTIPASSLSITSPSATTLSASTVVSFPWGSSFSLSNGNAVFATAAAGAGSGTADIDGTVALSAPTTTPAGSYTATLTLTVAGL